MGGKRSHNGRSVNFAAGRQELPVGGVAIGIFYHISP